MRNELILDSNNPDNPNKNICALAVAKALQVDSNVRYLHTVCDIVRAAKTRYNVRSKNTLAGLTVSDIRTKLSELLNSGIDTTLAYIVRVDEHAILLSADGETLVDTDPQVTDNRMITHIFEVY